jgi:predicted RNase H-like HicB family nuclease
MTMTYNCTIEQEGDMFIVQFPDMPNIQTYGNTYEEALAMAQEALEGCLESDIFRGLPIPPSAYYSGKKFITKNPAAGVPFRNPRRESEFSLLNGLFDGIVDKFGIPVVVEGLFFPDYGLYSRFKIVLAGLAEVPMTNLEIIPVGYRIIHCMSAYITGKGLHIKLLILSMYLNYTPGLKKCRGGALRHNFSK